MLQKKEFYKIQELAHEFSLLTGKKISTTKRALYRELEKGHLRGVKLLNSIMIPYIDAMAALKGKPTLYDD